MTMNTWMKEILSYRKKAEDRNRDGIFLVEGEKMFREIPDGDIVSIFCTKSYASSHKEIVSYEPNISVRILSDSEFERISDTKTPQGILALVKMHTHKEEELLSHKNGCFLLLENVQDPGNVGTIIRSAEAAGCDGIFLDKNTADPYNPKVVRSTMGAIFRVPFVITENLTGVAEKIQKNGGLIYATSLQATRPYTACDYRSLCGFYIGNESRGLSEEAISSSDIAIKIPMEGKVESLNAAMATTIQLYEVHRQRSNE